MSPLRWESYVIFANRLLSVSQTILMHERLESSDSTSCDSDFIFVTVVNINIIGTFFFFFLIDRHILTTTPYFQSKLYFRLPAASLVLARAATGGANEVSATEATATGLLQ